MLSWILLKAAGHCWKGVRASLEHPEHWCVTCPGLKQLWLRSSKGESSHPKLAFLWHNQFFVLIAPLMSSSMLPLRKMMCASNLLSCSTGSQKPLNDLIVHPDFCSFISSCCRGSHWGIEFTSEERMELCWFFSSKEASSVLFWNQLFSLAMILPKHAGRWGFGVHVSQICLVYPTTGTHREEMQDWQITLVHSEMKRLLLYLSTVWRKWVGLEMNFHSDIAPQGCCKMCCCFSSFLTLLPTTHQAIHCHSPSQQCCKSLKAGKSPENRTVSSTK